ncbi:Trx7/PDZ domain-containing (seleno)protein [Lignipirellula cremea]|uniref:Uncharacterized protein n=1 Tax=Lignipirellula cremea TaxID=2528010 RepID=A0A518DVP4_9BACT|nr:Trx7/PDZ domain-containing (seleno)protein [Lignipirellula cremea]QDU95910.1 hypothetical protein Pla8534_37290 [Lignipirellula cremea]
MIRWSSVTTTTSLLACSIFLASLAAGAEAPWKEVLTPEDGEFPLPAPRSEVVWLDNFSTAFRIARAENRPLFITFRCLPCKQCADFDKNVLEGGAEIDPLLRQFVTLRVTDARYIDLRLFPIEGYQDLDLSWWGYLVSPEGRIYAIFGGRDEVSDSTRISIEALSNTMKRVLQHHYHPQRKAWDIDGPLPDFSTAPTPTDSLPGYKSWQSSMTEKQTCIHCHQVSDILRQPAIDAHTFDKKLDTQIWPLPENVGITLDRDDGLKVTQVDAGSPAAKAGVQPGDSLAAAGERRLFGQADFRGVLHRGPKGDGQIPLYWTRGDKLHQGVLEVKGDWRETDLGWRQSISQGNIGCGPGFFPLKANQNLRKTLKIADDKMAIAPFMGEYHQKLPAYKAGLRTTDTVTAVNGQSPPLTGRPFLVWFRMNVDPGDKVTLTAVDRKGTARPVSFVAE